MSTAGWIVRSIEQLWHDVRHAGRMFVKQPVFAAIAIVSIAFGSGANVAIFSVVDALLLKPLPVANPSELLIVGSRVTRGIATRNVASYPDYLDYRTRTTSFDDLVASVGEFAGLAKHAGARPQERFVTFVSSNFFSALGVPPELGRTFVQEEESDPARPPVVMLSHGLWQTEFNGDPNIVGTRIRVAGLDAEIVGVVPEWFTGMNILRITESMFLPLSMWSRVTPRPNGDPLKDRDLRELSVRGRLRQGVTPSAARAEFAALGLDLERAYPDTNTGRAPVIQTELEMRFERSPLDSGVLIMLTTLSIAVLCVACANVAGLLASRAPVRAREMALRLAIGAGRARLVRQLLTENLAIALAGGVGGLGVGYLGILLLRQIRFPTDVVARPQLHMDERVLVFSLLVAMASAVVFGLGPAVQTTKVDLQRSLKTSEVGADRRRRFRGRSLLVASQVALSLVLLTIAAFAVQVVRRELAVGPGFRIENIAKMSVDPTQAQYTRVQGVVFFTKVLESMRALPSVKSASVTSAMPMFSFEMTPIVPEGYVFASGQTNLLVCTNSVDEQFFDTMDIPILAGRAFERTDEMGKARVAIVNETFAKNIWPGENAVGKRFRLLDRDGALVEVVGVARPTRIFYPGEPPQNALYFPFRQQPKGYMVLLAHTNGDPADMLVPMRDLIAALDADVPTYDAQTGETFFEIRVRGIAGVLIGLIMGMGVMGMALTMVGLYGLVSFSASRRTKEIGIRIAIGATHGRVLRMILREGMMPAWAGLGAGLVLSSITARLLPGLLPMTHHYDSSTWVVVVPLLVIVTLVAAYVPARRAAYTAPTLALRQE